MNGKRMIDSAEEKYILFDSKITFITFKIMI